MAASVTLNGAGVTSYGITLPVIGAATVAISEDEFLQIKRAHDVIEDSFRVERAFDLLAENYFEFEQELLRSSLEQMVFQGATWRSFVENHQTVCRRIMNALSTGTQYYDQLRVDTDPAADAEVQQRKRKIRSESLEFQAGREIRNSITHWHFDAFTMSSFIRADDNDDDRQIRFGTAPKLRVEALSDDPSPQRDRKLIARLKKMGEQIDLTKMIRGYVECLGDLHQFSRECRKQILTDAKQVYDQALARRDQLGHKSGVEAVAVDEEGEPVDSCYVSADVLEYLEALQRKNSIHVNLTDRYVSSELDRKREPKKGSYNKDAWDD